MNLSFLLILCILVSKLALSQGGKVRMNFANEDNRWFDATIYLTNKTQIKGKAQLSQQSTQQCNFRNEDDTLVLLSDSVEFIRLNNGQIVGSFYLHYLQIPSNEYTRPEHRSFIILQGHKKDLGLFALDNTQQNINSDGVSGYQYYIAVDGNPHAYLVDLQPLGIKRKRKKYPYMSISAIYNLLEESCPKFISYMEDYQADESFLPYERILSDYAKVCQ